jgi:hypothetical protein
MKGTNKWRIPVQGGAIFAGVQNLRGAKNSIKGVQPTAPKPSLNRHINQPAEAEPKPDLVDGYMQAMKDSAPAVARREALLAKIDRLFGLSADGWDERVLRFIERSEDAGQPLEVFREWMRRDPFNSPKINRIASDKGRPIKDTWKAAFMAYAEAGKSDVPLYE